MPSAELTPTAAVFRGVGFGEHPQAARLGTETRADQRRADAGAPAPAAMGGRADGQVHTHVVRVGLVAPRDDVGMSAVQLDVRDVDAVVGDDRRGRGGTGELLDQVGAPPLARPRLVPRRGHRGRVHPRVHEVEIRGIGVDDAQVEARKPEPREEVVDGRMFAALHAAADRGMVQHARPPVAKCRLTYLIASQITPRRRFPICPPPR